MRSTSSVVGTFRHAGVACRRPFSKEHRTLAGTRGKNPMARRGNSSWVTPWAHYVRSTTAVRQFAIAVVDCVQVIVAAPFCLGCWPFIPTWNEISVDWI